MPSDSFNIVPSFVLVCVMFILLFLPFQKWIESSLALQYDYEQVNYYSAVLDFITDYDKENPVTKTNGEFRLISLKEKSGDITPDERKNFNKRKKLFRKATLR